MKKANKAIMLLATLGALSGLTTPLQAITANVEQMQKLTQQQNRKTEIIIEIEKLTHSLSEVNQLLAHQLDLIDVDEYQQIKAVKLLLDYCFDMVKRNFTEEEAYTVFNAQIRAFSAQKMQFSLFSQQLKDKLEGVVVFSGLMNAVELQQLNEDIKSKWALNG